MNIILGATYRDRVTGYVGVAIGTTRWLTGCDTVGLQAPMSEDAKDRQEFTVSPARRTKRSAEAAAAAYEQAVRQRWRALALVIKAKLEAVESGISVFDEEFLANIMLPDGRTVGQFMLPQVAETYRNGTMPLLLPAVQS